MANAFLSQGLMALWSFRCWLAPVGWHLWMGKEGDVDAQASCIPSHVHHIVFEVLKNALRATALHHAAVANELPPVRVRIAEVRYVSYLRFIDVEH